MVRQDQQKLEIVWKRGLLVVELSKISGKESRNINVGKFNPTSQTRLSKLTTNVMERQTEYTELKNDLIDLLLSPLNFSPTSNMLYVRSGWNELSPLTQIQHNPTTLDKTF